MRCYQIMKNDIVPLTEYQPISDDIVLLDTNILIRLLYPMNFDNTSSALETLYQKLLQSKCRLLMSSIQISEFINTCIRLQYNIYRDTNNLSDYEFKKDYRGSDNYREESLNLTCREKQITHSPNFIQIKHPSFSLSILVHT